MFVLDTNTLVYFFRGEGRVAERLLGTSPTDIAVPSIVIYELETGLAKSKDPARRRSQLDLFVRTLAILPFDVDAARAAASIRAHLEREGTPIGPLDTLIAGTARAVRGTLVTRNLSEFRRVPGLTSEDWYS